MSQSYNRFKELRIKKGLTQQNLADLLKIDRTSISKYENGKQLPEIEILKDMAKFFNVTTDYLLGRSDTPDIVAEQATQYRTREQNEKIADELIRILIEKGEIEEGEELSEEKLEKLIKKIAMFIDASKL